MLHFFSSCVSSTARETARQGGQEHGVAKCLQFYMTPAVTLSGCVWEVYPCRRDISSVHVHFCTGVRVVYDVYFECQCMKVCRLSVSELFLVTSKGLREYERSLNDVPLIIQVHSVQSVCVYGILLTA